MLNRVTLMAMLVALGVKPVLAEDVKKPAVPADAQGEPLVFPDDEEKKQGVGGAGWPGGMPRELIELQEQLMAARRGGAVLGPAEMEQIKNLQQQMVQKMRDHMARLHIDANGGRIAVPGAIVQMQAQGGEVAMEKAAYLGVMTVPVNGTVRAQLKIEKGMGLTVVFVEKGSPAEGAGLKKDDILLKIGDQQLVNAEQLAVLIRNKKEGDEVTLTVLREAKPVEMKAKLAEKEMPVLGQAEGGGGWMMPAEQAGRVMVAPPIVVQQGDGGQGFRRAESISISAGPEGTTRTLKDGEHEVVVKTTPAGTTVTAKTLDGKEVFSGNYNTEEEKKAVPATVKGKVEKVMDSNRVIIKGGAVGGNWRNIPPEEGAAHGAAKSTLTRSDDTHGITLNVDNGKKTVTVVDVKSGKVIFEGPVNTVEERAKLPAGVAEKVKKLEGKVE